MTVRDELIELDGLRFHYRDWSSSKPNSPALILLHGYTGHARSWDKFADEMSSAYRVFALDQRGHGETQWAPSDRYGTEDMVADLDKFVTALDLDDFALLGLSMGGLVSIAYAGTRPSGLHKLVIVDIAPEIAKSGLRGIRSNVARSDLFDSVEEAYDRARLDNPIPPENHHYDRVRHSLMRTQSGQWTYRYDRALRDPEVNRIRMSPEQGWQAAAKINVPTLLIRGENSNILDGDVAKRFEKTVPECGVVEIAGSGHSVPLDKPEEFAVVASQFLE